MDSVIQSLIDRYRLQPLPVEGTLFAQTYRSVAEISPGHPVGTAMVGLYCEEPRSHSLFHRLTLDELWHFYAGDPFRLILLWPDGSSKEVVLGPNPNVGHQAQFCVPAGVWQAAHLIEGGQYSLYGCTMAPGWIPSCFEAGTRSMLMASHPDRAEDIERWACPEGSAWFPKEAPGTNQ